MLSSDRVRWSERRRLRGCSGGDFWLCCAEWKWAGVTLMITFTTAQSLLWHLCETRGCSAALHQLQPLSCLICCQKTFATHQVHFFSPTMCRWMTYSSYKQTSINTRFLCLIFDLCFYNCTTACEKLKWLRRWTEQAKTANWAFQVNSLHSPDKFSESCANLYSSCFWS